MRQPPPLPPRPEGPDIIHSPLPLPPRPRFTPSSQYEKVKIPTSRRKVWAWSIAFGALVIVVAVVAICATVIPKSRRHALAVSDGGHPLSRSQGGVNKGSPGDIAKFGANSTDHFVLTSNRSTVVTRLDPIISPNQISGHVHRVHGSSYYTANITSATELQHLAKCSTAYVQDDKSAYWVPQLYHLHVNSSIEAIRLDRTSLYYFQKAPTGTPIFPFPNNYNIVVGDPYRRSVNYSDP
jgi:hypothetical protein